MRPSARAELEAALDRHIAEENPGAPIGSATRLRWLSHHLSLYTSRLAGFAAIPDVPIDALQEHDLYRAVEAAAAAIDREFAASVTTRNLRSEWSGVRDALDTLHTNLGRARIDALHVAAFEWRAKVFASG